MTTKLLAALRHAPFALSLTASLLVVAVVSGALFAPASQASWYPSVATGLPAFAEGRWWSPLTSMFFVGEPWVYAFVVPFVLLSTAWAEWRFGTLRTVAIFLGGHLVGVLGGALLVLGAAAAGSSWAQHLTTHLDVGPSCGAIAALVFAIATLRSPWRLRARALVVVWVVLSLLYLGQLYDVEHAVAMLAALALSGWLPAFRHHRGRPTEREWRFLAFAGLLTVGAMQVFDLAVPIDGPLGQSDPRASALDVAIDLLVIGLVANGVRRGFRVAWIATLALACFNFLTAGVLFALIPSLVADGLIDHAGQVLGLIIAPTVLWVGEVVILVLGRSAFHVRLRRSRRALEATAATEAENRRALLAFGGGTISWMTTWPLNAHARVAGGTAAFQSHAGVALMLGDPIVPNGQLATALEEFAGAAQRAGLVPAVFSAGQASFEARPAGWRSLIVAEDTIVDLPGLAFTGKAWGSVRTALNRAEREHISFRMTRLIDEHHSVLAQVRRISEQWTGDKSLPEMRFTLGTVQEALDPEVLVGLAFDAAGTLQGVTSWLPVYGRAAHGRATAVDVGSAPVGWTLDIMRRADDSFPLTMEFLIASSVRHFADEGYAFVSLSGAPFIHPDGRELTPVDQVLTRIGELIEPMYGFRSLHRFKQKFNPRAAPLYLLYRDEGDLPRIGVALTRAYLPDASLRDLITTATASASSERPPRPN